MQNLKYLVQATVRCCKFRGRQLWRRTRNFLLIFLPFYVYDLIFKPRGSTTFWLSFKHCYSDLTHWGRAKHICVVKQTFIGSDNGLSPGRLQAIIWTNAGILLIGPLGTNFSEILIGIQTFSVKKMHLKMLSAKWRPFCLGLNVLNNSYSLAFPLSKIVAMCDTLLLGWCVICLTKHWHRRI